MNAMFEKAKAIEQTMIQDRRALHQIPEFGIYTPQTADYVAKRLDEMGIVNKRCGIHKQEDKDLMSAMGYPHWPESTGVVGQVGKGEHCFLLRADMDGLPIKEDTGLPFASTNGSGHMCGHDAHAAMLLGAAKILKDMEDELPGVVKLMFQPGEEMGYGSRTMVEDGVLENPKVEAAMGLHVAPTEKVGHLQFCPTVTSGSMATIVVKIQGRGGHSSDPSKTIDPVTIATEVANAVQLIIPREVDPDLFATLTVGTIHSGTASNIIPDTAELALSFRTLSPEVYEHLLKRVPEVVDGYVKAWRGTYSTLALKTPGTVCNAELSEQITGYIGDGILDAKEIEKIPPFKGAEDFAHVAKKVPAFYGFIGAGQPGNYPLHSPHFVLDENVLAYGAAILADSAVRWLKDASEKK